MPSGVAKCACIACGAAKPNGMRYVVAKYTSMPYDRAELSYMQGGEASSAKLPCVCGGGGACTPCGNINSHSVPRGVANSA